MKLRQTSLPEEITEVQKRIKFIVHRMENAIANHEFEKARFYSDEERKERENLRALREKYHLDESATGVVGREDIEDVVSRWTGVPVMSIKEEESAKLLRIEEELHKRIISQDKSIVALSSRNSPFTCWTQEPEPSHWFVLIPRTYRRRQDRSRAHAGSIHVRQRKIADSIRHVRIHGEAFSIKADRLASRIRRIRRRWTAYRTREASAVFRRAAG